MLGSSLPLGHMQVLALHANQQHAELQRHGLLKQAPELNDQRLIQP